MLEKNLGHFNNRIHSCPICSKAQYHLFCTKNELKYLSCDFCGHVYVGNSIDQESLIDYYSSRQSHHSSATKEAWDYSELKSKMIYAPLLKRLASITVPDGLLDIGCSNGSFVAAALRQGWNAYGIELEKESYEICLKHGVRAYNAELHKQSFPDESFSAVTMWQVIEHLADPSEMVAEIYRVLKPGGVLAISTPNRKSLGWLLNGVQWQTIDPRVHLHLFDIDTLSRLLHSHKFVLRDMETMEIKLSTIHQFFRKKAKSGSLLRSKSVAEFVQSKDKTMLRYLLFIRNMINISLRWTSLGEDIYAYFMKPIKNRQFF